MSTPVAGTLVALALIAVLWFVVVAPAERRYHARKLELMRERIERRNRGTGDQHGDEERRGDDDGSR